MLIQTSVKNLGYPIYALEYGETKIRLVEDYAPPSAMQMKERNYSIESIAEFVSEKQKMKYERLGLKKDNLLPIQNRDFSFPLKNRHIKVMGKLANIEFDTWKKIIDIGKKYLQVTNRNWYQKNDESSDASYLIWQQNREIANLLQKDRSLQDSCKQFIERCPSRWYRAIVRLALNNCHWTSGDTGEKYEGHNHP